MAVPVTVKSRIGVDEHDSYAELQHFIRIVSEAGCRIFIVHARKAWLSGLSPKENREIPPLQYAVVEQLKQDFPDLTFILNGGITRLETCQHWLQRLDGVMLGREAYHNPYILAEVDNLIYAESRPIPSRQDIVMALLPYIESQLAQGARLNNITRHILGLFHGVDGARAWRRHLSENSTKPGATAQIVLDALQYT